jgi:hypothetical protein
MAHHWGTKRQVSLEFQDDGKSINVIRIDEHLERDEQTVESVQAGLVRDTIAWLNRQA